MKLTAEFIREITSPGVYIMRRKNKVLYVGMSSQGGARFFSPGHKMRPHLLKGDVDIEFRETESTEAALELETQLIKEFRPPHNVAKNDGRQIRNPRSDKNPKFSPSLAEKYFHSFTENDTLKWQGQILKEVAPGKFLIQLYSWIGGFPSDQMVISIDQMIQEKWKFYGYADDWREIASSLEARTARVIDAELDAEEATQVQ